MNLTLRRQIYKTLRNFSDGIKEAANEANITDRQLRIVMTAQAEISEKQAYIIEACQSVINKRTMVLKEDIKETGKGFLKLANII